MQTVSKRLSGTTDHIITSDGECYRVLNGQRYDLAPQYDAEYPYWLVWADGGWRRYYCHRTMAMHFLDKPEGCEIVSHKDDNKQNFALSNLEWTTQSHNVKLAYAHNLHGKVTPYEVVQRIKRFLQQGFSMKDIAAWTGVGYQTIYDIKAGRRHA